MRTDSRTHIGAIVIALALLATFSAARIEFRPLPKEVESSGESATARDPRLVFRFFDEDFISGGYEYWYPDRSKVFIPEESGRNGEVALEFDLAADDYAGGSVCLYNLLYDMSPYYETGALQFWVKGARGGEIAWVALVDDENGDGRKTVVRLPVNDFGGITAEWTQVSVPLTRFGRRGVYWDPKKLVEIPERFQWEKVAEFRIEIKKADNESFRVRVDDIFVLRDVYPRGTAAEEEYWDERDEVLEPPPAAQGPEVKAVQTVFGDALPGGAFAYVYGGKTAWKVQPTTAAKDAGILAMYLDNADYSGVTVALGAGRSVDLSRLRGTNAGIAFWARTAEKVKSVFLGVLDDDSDGAKVQTKVALGDYGEVDTTWRYFMVPLKRFAPKGKYWDEGKKAEVLADVRWEQINEFRFSINRFDNRLPEGQPVCLYLDDIEVIEEIPGYVDPDEYWASFQSDAPDVLLHDFESESDSRWQTAMGEKSRIDFSFVNPGEEDKGKRCLQVDYKLLDWCDIMFEYDTSDTRSAGRDWSRHWALRFSFYAGKPYQAVTVQVNDAGNEIFVANVGGRRGWNEVLLPLRDFGKFPYYQPPDAEQNGLFDLNGVRKIDFKPAGEGTSGEYRLDNVRLTNLREIPKAGAVEEVAVSVRGNLDETVTERINEGIFGINVALWDGDLLKPETIERVKAVGHGMLRYPGGLRADEDHWEEVLARKDWMVDTDEFLEFCTATGNQAMITVNFGRGTPEEAARWVKHVNIDRKFGVKHWEVGNELYGDWHAQHCTAEEYGSRAAQFIKAMKAVDPSILVTVVWVLEGPWNKTVFEHTRDLADGVNVHHYPQHAGEENDFALLAAPRSLNDILPSVRRQAEQYGAAGKEYQVWLTEWNSVDFNPGPQTLSAVNGLFVVDYLATLAVHNVEQASYWDVHNDLTPEGGDYGYLSRTGAPDGDNVPRPSYWAFFLAGDALRGRLAACTADNEDVGSYLCVHPDGAKTLLITNRLPETRARVTLNIPGFSGKALVKEYAPATVAKGLLEREMLLGEGDTLVAKPHSAVSITVR